MKNPFGKKSEEYTFQERIFDYLSDGWEHEQADIIEACLDLKSNPKSRHLLAVWIANMRPIMAKQKLGILVQRYEDATTYRMVKFFYKKK